MSMDLTVYVGPYLIVPKGVFDLCDWENIVREGRGEDGVDESNWILIPNKKLDGIERSMTVDRHGDQEMAQINPATIVRETAAFSRLAIGLICWCDDRGIEVREAWGVVPCWS
jgi:hypothetical protein